MWTEKIVSIHNWKVLETFVEGKQNMFERQLTDTEFKESYKKNYIFAKIYVI